MHYCYEFNSFVATLIVLSDVVSMNVFYSEILSDMLCNNTVVCKKIAAVHEKAYFWLFLVEISLHFGKALNC